MGGILDAITKRDLEEAVTLLEKHILEVGSRFQGCRTSS
jgi:DNA-binding GntR family transcriptional regulator